MPVGELQATSEAFSICRGLLLRPEYSVILYCGIVAHQIVLDTEGRDLKLIIWLTPIWTVLQKLSQEVMWHHKGPF